MRRILALTLLFILAAGCAASGGGLGGKLDREDILPNDLVSVFAGAPMVLTRDARDDGKGFVCWAWEETDSTPKLLLVELWMPPADCDGLYRKAGEGAEAIPSAEGTTACYDERAVHMRCGAFYVRISLLGFHEENSAIELLTARLAAKLPSVK